MGHVIDHELLKLQVLSIFSLIYIYRELIKVLATPCLTRSNATSLLEIPGGAASSDFMCKLLPQVRVFGENVLH